ncbi:MAG: hypothetical protein WB952_13400 [Terriglobales bacterium]
MFTVPGGQQIQRTCSIGWSVFPWFADAPDAVRYDKVLQLADSALYEAKNTGRNQAIGMLPSSGHTAFVSLDLASGGSLIEKLGARTVYTQGPKTPAESSTEPSTRALAASEKV